VTPETCRVALQWINICILLHLLDFYSHWIKMHGTMRLKNQKHVTDLNFSTFFLPRIPGIVKRGRGFVTGRNLKEIPSHEWNWLSYFFRAGKAPIPAANRFDIVRLRFRDRGYCWTVLCFVHIKCDKTNISVEFQSSVYLWKQRASVSSPLFSLFDRHSGINGQGSHS